jgi:3-demethoxyubiquinol 3-hydroxylase
MWFWSWGGFVLGIATAFMGRNAIMVCTESVENAVHSHMQDQIRFLNGKDENLKNLIEDIMVEEIQHLRFAQDRVKHNVWTSILSSLIHGATEIVIWLSTHGDSARMRSDLKRMQEL